MSSRILMVGYARPGFGFGRVLFNLASLTAERYEVLVLELAPGDAYKAPFSVRIREADGDLIGTGEFKEVIREFNPNLIMVYHELWIIPHYLIAAKSVADVPVIAYSPIDGEIAHPFFLPELQNLDLLLLFHPFSREILERAHEIYQQETGDKLDLPKISYLPHGVETGRFYPLLREHGIGRRHYARSMLWPDRPELADAVIILNANRNQPRKRIDLTIKAFSEFSRGKPSNVFLCLHMGLVDEGVDVMRMADECGIEDRLLTTSHGDERAVLTDEQMNLLFNACDIGLNTSMGEGWGLVSFEHGSTGAAQVMTSNAASQALWSDNGLLVNCEDTEEFLGCLVVKAPTVEGIVSALEVLHEKPCLRLEYDNRARVLARESSMSWSEVGQQLSSTISEFVR